MRHRGWLLWFAVLGAAAASAATGEGKADWTERGSGIVFPGTLGTLEKEGVREYETPDLGVSVRYAGPNLLKADVYVYTGGYKKIPDGVDSAIVTNHFHAMAQGLQSFVKAGLYSGLVELPQDVRVLGGTNSTRRALCKTFEYRQTEKAGDGSTAKRKSYLLLTGYKNRFVKVRFTFLADKAAEGDQILKAFLLDLGRILK